VKTLSGELPFEVRIPNSVRRRSEEERATGMGVSAPDATCPFTLRGRRAERAGAAGERPDRPLYRAGAVKVA